MLRIENVKQLLAREVLNKLEPTGWRYKEQGSEFWFERILEEKTDYLFFAIKEHFDPKHLVKYHISRPIAGRRFNLVEETLKKVFAWKVEDMELATISPVNFYDGGMDDRLPPPLSGSTTEEGTLNDVFILIEYIERYLIPFFSMYSSIQDVDKKIQTLPIVDLHKFIGNEVIGRRMVIMKVSQNPQFEEYFEMIRIYFEDEIKKGNNDVRDDLDKYSKLYNHLIENHQNRL